MKNKEKFDYSVLADAVVDEAVNALCTKKFKKSLKLWQFENVEVNEKTTFLAGNQAEIIFRTPDGKKKVILTAKLQKT